MMLLVTFLVTRILALPVVRPEENAVAVLETNAVSILVPILLAFLVDCPKHLLVQNKITSQYILHIEPRTLQIQNEHEKVAKKVH